MHRTNTILVFFLLICFAASAPLKALQLSGKVRHAHTYQGIANAYIYLNTHALGTISAIDGTFELQIPDSLSDEMLVFEHVAFDSLHIPVRAAKQQTDFYLKPRILFSEAISIVANRQLPEIFLDLPQAFTTLKAASFENRGYVDTGDLLATNQDIQVEEELSGKKTIAIRAGNADDVLVLYNGVKLNSSFDNEFDVSQLNLQDIKQIEIIRGSNTSLYGAEAFSGVVNIVPQLHKPYQARFTQRIGSYASGDWGLQTHHSFGKRLGLSYSYRQGASKRGFKHISGSQELQNSYGDHFASAVYDFATAAEENNLSLLYLNTDHHYRNTRFDEQLQNRNQLFSLRYSGPLNKRDQLTLSTAYKSVNNDHNLTVTEDDLERSFYTRSIHLQARNAFSHRWGDWLVGSQYEQTGLQYKDLTVYGGRFTSGVKKADFIRRQFGLVSILKMHVPTASNFLDQADISFSYRYDGIQTEQNAYLVTGSVSREILARAEQLDANTWRASTYRFSSNFIFNYPYFAIRSYLNFGSNIKFPSLYQQLSIPRLSSTSQNYATPSLNPEKNRSLEIGTEFSKENQALGPLSGWRFHFNYFLNYFHNKFRVYYLPNTPVSYYDNVSNANINGLEANLQTYFWGGKMRLESGLSHYSVSEKAAFPLKSEWRMIQNINLDHAGYSLLVYLFRETDQVAWIRDSGGQYWEVSLPGFANMDLHAYKEFEIKAFKLILSASARNILQDKTELEGIAIHDRRFYLSFGLQY